MEVMITEKMAEVLKHLRYDKETNTILADCNFSANPEKKEGAPLEEAPQCD